jgi:hypothetical protein
MPSQPGSAQAIGGFDAELVPPKYVNRNSCLNTAAETPRPKILRQARIPK